MSLLSRSWWPALCLSTFLLGGFSLAQAAFVAPASWVRGVDPGSTYQEWDVFTSTTGPNAPNSPGVPPAAVVAAAPFNPNGVADAFDTAGGSFVTGGGNIYSPTAIVDVDVLVPNYAAGAATWTTVLLQTRTQGNSIDPAGVRLSGPGGTLAPVDSALLFVQPLGGFGGNLEDRWFEFIVPGNAASYLLEFAGAASSVSVDKISVDTVWTSAANPLRDPNPVVPEPRAGVLAILAAGVSLGLAYWRSTRRTRNMT